MSHTFVLASASPRRRELLAELGVTFDVVPALIDEREDTSGDPSAIALHNAQIKGEWVVAQGHTCVLSADTIVALDGKIFHKPANLNEARDMLRTLSGRTHQVYTGVYWRTPYTTELHCEITAVTFNTLDDNAIDAYFQVVNPLDKSGAYAIQQGLGSVVAAYHGSLSNVMGLPVEWFTPRLKALAQN